jgi:hypothetical protein
MQQQQPASRLESHGSLGALQSVIPGSIAAPIDGGVKERNRRLAFSGPPTGAKEKQAPTLLLHSIRSSSHLENWLENRLRADRLALLHRMENLQGDLVKDFQRELFAHDDSCKLKWSDRSWPRAAPQAPQAQDEQDEEAAEALSTTTSEDLPTEIVVVASTISEDLPMRSLTTQQSKEQEGNRLRSFIKSQRFELLCVSLVFLNAFLMAAKIQYEGISNGHELGVRKYDIAAEVRWPWAQHVFPVMDRIFSVVFGCELLVRLWAYRLEWFCSVWSYLDALVVGIDIASYFEMASISLNAYILRMARFAKLVRIVRVMRSNKLLDSLKLLVASIQASSNTLWISLVVLLVIQSVAGMLLSQLVAPYINDESQPVELRKEVFRHYGTFWRSMITMFEITFANWAPTCRLLIDNVNELFGIFFLVYRCLVGFAMLSVIQAVFIQQTMKSAQLDDDFVIAQRIREKQAYSEKLYRVFRQLDTSGDGHVSWREFEALLTEPRMKLLMSTLEVDVRELETLFKLLDDGDGFISPDEFIEGLQRMKGNAKALDLMALTRSVQRIEAVLGTGSPQGRVLELQ